MSFRIKISLEEKGLQSAICKLQSILIAVLLLTGCKDDLLQNQTPVAKVLDKILYESELKEIIPDGTPKHDSTLMAQSYIRNWVTKQLLLNKALENLTDEEKDIRKQVEDYSSSILIHKYKEKFVSQKMEKEISEKDINDYYEANKLNFVLNHTIVRAVLVILPKETLDVEYFKKLFYSKDPDDEAAIEEYCITYAKKYDNFGDKWIEVRYLLNWLPVNQQEWGEKYKNKTVFEIEDAENFYFVKINETYKEHDIAPAGFVKQEIKMILLNKRKLSFEEDLERSINDEGKRKSIVTIYN